MIFIDSVTPTNQQYQDAARNYAGNGNETTRQRANDWATMYYQNAYNTALMNYMNRYNTPQMQMLRYMEAGLNPNLVSADSGNMGSSIAGAAPKGSTDRGPTRMDLANLALDSVNSVQKSMESAKLIYDYLNYGREASSLRNSILRNENTAKQAEADWQMYWNYGPGMGPNSPYVEGSPRASYMEFSAQRISAQVAQLQGLVNQIYPSQKSANDAMTALRNLQKEIEEGKKGAILNLNTGYDGLDSILKMICFWLLGK